jgi:hypothetical protein
MCWLEYPSKELWESRRIWFEQTSESFQGEGSYIVGEQACALMGEVQTVFCSGSWIAVIVLATAVVDAQFRETGDSDFKGNTKDLLDANEVNPELQRIRARCNTIIHINPNQPAITLDIQWGNRKELEEEAKQAVKLMFEAFFMYPGT